MLFNQLGRRSVPFLPLVTWRHKSPKSEPSNNYEVTELPTSKTIISSLEINKSQANFLVLLNYVKQNVLCDVTSLNTPSSHHTVTNFNVWPLPLGAWWMATISHSWLRHNFHALWCCVIIIKWMRLFTGKFLPYRRLEDLNINIIGL